MKKSILLFVVVTTTSLSSMAQSFTKDTGNRDLPFDSVDLQILNKANEILSTEATWSKEDDRVCQDDIDSGKFSLFCALFKASLDVVGEYDHRKPGLQQVRWIIGSKYKDRLAGHRLMDFNNHEKTSFDEIKKLLSESISITKQKMIKE